MLITNQTGLDYWFGSLHLPAGVGQTLTVDDTDENSIYNANDAVADAINAAYANSKITVSGQAAGFPRAIYAPDVYHGDGAPEGVYFAPQGSIFLRRDTALIYQKTSDVHVATGWHQVSTQVPITTSAFSGGPPGSPSDGDIWIATGVGSGGQRWQFQYDAGESTSYKWKFIGGAPVSTQIGDNNNHANTSNSTWQNVGGLSLSIPRAGFYRIEWGAMVEVAVSSTTQECYIAPGTTTSSVLDSIYPFAYAQATSGSIYPNFAIHSQCDMIQRGLSALAASSTLYLNMDSTNTGAINFTNMWMNIIPQKIS